MLLWLDLETTGLNPVTDRILEVAWTLTNDDLSPVRWGVSPFPLQTRVLGANATVRQRFRESVPFVFDMHMNSGLWEEVLESNYLVEDVEDEIIDNLRELVPPKETVYLAGASVHFDKAFLAEWMPALHARLSHRVYDTSTLKAFFRSVGIEHGIVNHGQHRAANDVDEVLSVARAYADQTVSIQSFARPYQPVKENTNG